MPLTTYDPSLESQGDRPAMANKAAFDAYTTAITALLALIQRYIEAIGFRDDCRCSLEHCPDVDFLTATLSGFADCPRIPVGLGKFINTPWSGFNREIVMDRSAENQWRWDDVWLVSVYSDSECTIEDELSPLTLAVFVTCNCYDGAGFGFTVGVGPSSNASLVYGSAGAVWQSDGGGLGPVFPNGDNPFDDCPWAGNGGAAIITMSASFDTSDFNNLVAAVNALAPVGVPPIIWMRSRHPKKEAIYPV